MWAFSDGAWPRPHADADSRGLRAPPVEGRRLPGSSRPGKPRPQPGFEPEDKGTWRSRGCEGFVFSTGGASSSPVWIRTATSVNVLGTLDWLTPNDAQFRRERGCRRAPYRARMRSSRSARACCSRSAMRRARSSVAWPAGSGSLPCSRTPSSVPQVRTRRPGTIDPAGERCRSSRRMSRPPAASASAERRLHALPRLDDSGGLGPAAARSRFQQLQRVPLGGPPAVW